jgi:altronate hydrolase
LKLHPRDDVVIAKEPLERGSLIETDTGPVALAEAVGPGHKVAIRARGTGDPVRRYGEIIGVASAPIQPGDHVHIHNLRQPEQREEDEARVDTVPNGRGAPQDTRYFDGYLRADGRVGTRNYIAIVSTVNCSASVCHFVRDRFHDVERRYPNVDGVIALTHKSGCGLVSGGDDHLLLERVLGGYARHPNVAAYIVIGLGCEVNQAAPMVARHGLSLLSDERPPIIGIQFEGGVRKTVDAAAEAVNKLLPVANNARRTKRSASGLTDIPASRPTLHSGLRSTNSFASAVRRCWGRPPRSSAPSTF